MGVAGESDGLGRPDRTDLITKGVRRHFATKRFEGVMEFRLSRLLRCDLLLVNPKNEIIIIEVKSGLEDFRADHKWSGYLEWCDRFYFAVDDGFPLDCAPNDVGLLRADAFDAAVLREAPERRLPPARRKALTIKLALAAAERLRRLEDPGARAPVGAPPSG